MPTLLNSSGRSSGAGVPGDDVAHRDQFLGLQGAFVQRQADVAGFTECGGDVFDDDRGSGRRLSPSRRAARESIRDG